MFHTETQKALKDKDCGVVTKFQKRVYDAVSCVPMGRVTTYKMLAQHIGCGAPRAIGQALRRNPFAPQVPCHRVISSDLSVGGFCGEKTGAAIKKKINLLQSEGVEFTPDERLRDKRKVWKFE